MQGIYNEKTDKFAFQDMTFEEVTILEYALIEYAMKMEGKPIENEIIPLIDCCDFMQSQAI